MPQDRLQRLGWYQHTTRGAAPVRRPYSASARYHSTLATLTPMSTTTTTTTTATYRPTADEIAAAGRVVAYFLRSYSNGQMGLHEASDVAARAARLLAPAVYESAMDSGCTDIRPVDGDKRMAAWDAVVLAHVLNAVAP